MNPYNQTCPYLYRGKVEVNEDPKNLGRCRIRVPAIHGELNYSVDILPWARPISISPVSSGRGAVNIPDVGDVVWVLFEGSNREYPVYFGGTYAQDEVTIDSSQVVLYLENGNQILYDRNSNSYKLNSGDNSILLSSSGIVVSGTLYVEGDIKTSGSIDSGVSMDIPEVSNGESYSPGTESSGGGAGDLKDGRVLELTAGGNFECPYSNTHAYTYMGWQLISVYQNANGTFPSDQAELAYTNYSPWKNTKYNSNSGNSDAFDSEGFGKIGGRYVVATTSKNDGGIASVGDKIDVYLENGNTIKCIVGDIKSSGDSTWTKWGHASGDSVSVIEFVVNTTNTSTATWYDATSHGGAHVNPGNADCHPEWASNITKIMVGGTEEYEQGPAGSLEEKFSRATAGRGINRYSDSSSYCGSLITSISVKCRDENGKDYTKKLSVNKYIKDDIIAIFQDIYNNTSFRIRSSDTGAYCYRNVAGTSKLSYHSYGVAIDLNWNANPYSKSAGGSDDNIRIRTEKHPVVQIFYKHGWGWGGTYEDHMHFSYFNGH